MPAHVKTLYLSYLSLFKDQVLIKVQAAQIDVTVGAPDRYHKAQHHPQ